MTSLRRIAANRANAQKSTGPKTPEGKARAADNSIRHGLYSRRTIILSNEEPEALEQIRHDYIQKYRPTDAAELIYVETMINADWRLRRIWDLEPAAVDFVVDAQAPEIAADAPDADNPTRTAIAVTELADQSRILDMLNRYETTYMRQLERAQRNLERMRQQARHDTAPVGAAVLEALPSSFKPGAPAQPGAETENCGNEAIEPAAGVPNHNADAPDSPSQGA
ncbi:MAG: hypothetical protein R2729_23900 [Bryobacteraceae bacterium]